MGAVITYDKDGNELQRRFIISGEIVVPIRCVISADTPEEAIEIYRSRAEKGEVGVDKSDLAIYSMDMDITIGEIKPKIKRKK